MSDFIDMTIKLKQLSPRSNFYQEPEYSFNKIIEYENKYNMNTRDALDLYFKLDEEIHFNSRYHYLWDWINEYESYEFFDGDMSKINTQ